MLRGGLTRQLMLGGLLAFGAQQQAEARTAAYTVGDDVRVAVVPALVEGDVPSEVLDALNGRVMEALQSDKYELVKARASGPCTDYKCIRRVAKAAKARYVVVPSIATTEHDYGIAIYVYDVDGGRGLDRKTTCEICSYDEAVDSLVTQAKDLHDPLVQLVVNPYGDREQETDDEEGPATLVVRTAPKGAVVKVNGQKVGTTPLSQPIQPGLKDIEIKRRGFATISRSLRLTRGNRTELSFELVETREKQTKALRAIGISFTILGIGMLGAGAPLLAIDERPFKKRCDGENIDFNGACRFRYNTLVPGALLTSFGVAFLITGISTGLVAFSRKQRKKKDEQTDDLDEDTISVTPVIGPTSAGVRVRF